jgi:hypothetical protein
MTDPIINTTDIVTIDAYTGEGSGVAGHFVSNYKSWALGTPIYGQPVMAPDPIDPAQWQDDRIGWGVILPEPAGLPPDQLAGAADAPEPIRELVATRGGKVLRYRAGTAYGDWVLRDYASNVDLFTAASPVGAGPGQLPKYLLIYATPAEVPWHIQYALNPVRCVGRLDLTGDALANYVTALLEDWKCSSSSYAAPVVWAVDHGGGDITSLMRKAVAEPIFSALHGDDEMPAATYVGSDDRPATLEALYAALTTNKPLLVVTSSHGMTGPLDDPIAMGTSMGLPVDQAHHALQTQALLGQWQPDGAIWFAQACCSAGSDSPTMYAELFDPGSMLGRTLSNIASAPASISPLPRALLGARKPLRAFIGHVEPTFDWTLKFPPNRQLLASDLKSAVYQGLMSGLPVGLAMSVYYPAIATLLQTYSVSLQRYNQLAGVAAKPSLDMLVYSRVTAHDRASTVILGDPTAAIPKPTAATHL